MAKYHRIAGTHTNVGTSEETTLQFPAQGGGFSSEIWLLVAFHYVQSGGSASTYQPGVGQASGFTVGDINDRLAYSSTAVGTAVNDVYSSPILCLTDSNGRLYFKPGFNSGTDNDGDYEFWFRQAGKL